MLLFLFSKYLFVTIKYFDLLRKRFRKLLRLYNMDINTTKKLPNIAKEFFCKKCQYKCFKKSLFDKHLLTMKHNTLNTTKIQQKSFHSCECGKQYTHRASLFNHKRKCIYVEKEDEGEDEKVSEPIVEYLLKENLEMKKMMIELCKKIEPVSNNTNINSHNKIFNIQLFLNEDCKDAMNMTEFIESIQLSIEDVEKIGMEGQTQALSNILSSKLNEMDIFKRPVHCSDVKKEIIYVKDEDKWEQEDKDKPKLKKALDKIANESLSRVNELSGDQDTCIKIISEILKDPREDKKILSSVSKGMLI